MGLIGMYLWGMKRRRKCPWCPTRTKVKVTNDELYVHERYHYQLLMRLVWVNTLGGDSATLQQALNTCRILWIENGIPDSVENITGEQH